MRRMQKLTTYLSVLGGLLLVAGASSADQHSGKASVKQSVIDAKTACDSDIKKLCSDVTPGEGRIFECLESKRDKLSASCTSKLNLAKAEISKSIDRADVAFRKQCGNDVQKFCSDVPSGQGRLWDCLSEHEADLSRSCRSFQAKVSDKLSESIG